MDEAIKRLPILLWDVEIELPGEISLLLYRASRNPNIEGSEPAQLNKFLSQEPYTRLSPYHLTVLSRFYDEAEEIAASGNIDLLHYFANLPDAHIGIKQEPESNLTDGRKKFKMGEAVYGEYEDGEEIKISHGINLYFPGYAESCTDNTLAHEIAHHLDGIGANLLSNSALFRVALLAEFHQTNHSGEGYFSRFGEQFRRSWLYEDNQIAEELFGDMAADFYTGRMPKDSMIAAFFEKVAGCALEIYLESPPDGKKIGILKEALGSHWVQHHHLGGFTNAGKVTSEDFPEKYANACNSFAAAIKNRIEHGYSLNPGTARIQQEFHQHYEAIERKLLRHHYGSGHPENSWQNRMEKSLPEIDSREL